MLSAWQTVSDLPTRLFRAQRHLTIFNGRPVTLNWLHAISLVSLPAAKKNLLILDKRSEDGRFPPSERRAPDLGGFLADQLTFGISNHFTTLLGQRGTAPVAESPIKVRQIPVFPPSVDQFGGVTNTGKDAFFTLQ